MSEIQSLKGSFQEPLSSPFEEPFSEPLRGSLCRLKIEYSLFKPVDSIIIYFSPHFLYCKNPCAMNGTGITWLYRT